MSELILERKRRAKEIENGDKFLRISSSTHNLIAGVADETGMSFKEITDKLVQFAVDNVVFVESDV